MIKFKTESDSFFPSLKKDVNSLLTAELMVKAKRLLWFKFIFYTVFFIVSIIVLYSNVYGNNLGLLIINYIVVGQLGILLAFNAAHDAVHKTFSNRKIINSMIFHFSFNMQGVSARLWEIRHLASHHLFPNVDGCDADIDNNIILRLSPTHPKHKWQKYQHLYAPFLYSVYTLQWILMKDFVYLGKKNLANLKNQTHSFWTKLEVVMWKCIYFSYMIGIPYLLTDFSIGEIIIAFLIMHFFISLFFVFTLIISHLFNETSFPVADEKGYLPYTYHEHQLAVSLDYHPTSKIANWIFGGFNAHSAHHLFPGLPHTCYAAITPLIQNKTKEFNYPYHELNMIKAIQSHFKYLKKMGA